MQRISSVVRLSGIRHWLGLWIIAAGLRVCGYRPRQSVVYTSPCWDHPAETAVWAANYLMDDQHTNPESLGVIFTNNKVSNYFGAIMGHE